jgi:hypothetical protein
MIDYRAPEVPTIQVDSGSSFDPTKMLLALASQVATKVISDQFYESRREKITEDTQELLNIHESMKYLDKLNDPILLREESLKLQLQIESGVGPDGSPLSDEGKAALLTERTTLENRIGYMDSERSKELIQYAGDMGEWEIIFDNMSKSNDVAYRHVPTLVEQQGKLQALIKSIEASEGYKKGAGTDVLAHETFQAYDTLMGQQITAAKAVKEWDKRIHDYGQELDKVKGDEAKYMGQSAIYLKDLNDYLMENSAFIKDAGTAKLNDLRDEIIIVTQGHHFDNLIDKIRADKDFTSIEGTSLLDIADSMLAEGIATKSKGLIAKGINTVKQATTQEFIADRRAIAAAHKEQKAFATETLSGLSKQAELISTTIFGKGTSTVMETKAKIHSTYKEGAQKVMQNPENELKRFTGSEQSMVDLKVIMGKNISKLVKGSTFYNKNDDIKALVDSTLTGTGDFVKQDELFDIMYQKWIDGAGDEPDEADDGLELNFYGTGQADDAAREMLKEYLLLYRILRVRHEEAIALFGSEYYGKLKTISNFTDPYGESGKAISAAIMKKLFPDELDEDVLP